VIVNAPYIRFDREIEIDVPNEGNRLSILKSLTLAMPLSEDVDLLGIAGSTNGFVGADLTALCREAAMAAMQEGRLSSYVPSFFLDSFHSTADHTVQLELSLTQIFSKLSNSSPPQQPEAYKSPFLLTSPGLTLVVWKMSSLNSSKRLSGH
jgi:SpoVK/Ycf46/Vps4 family AAA+-type ATPase